MTFNDEQKFEDEVVSLLQKHGWKDGILEYPTEERLLRNFGEILYQNNCVPEKLGNYPLTDTEVMQIIDQVNNLKTPLAINGLIAGKQVNILRDNPDDEAHLGKTVSLNLFDKDQIGAGSSRYQIARQPKFDRWNKLAKTRRGDLTLLINGMPLIHLELKKSGVPISNATSQIEKYTKEGIFRRGIMAFVQVFVAMNPEESVYFANPGYDGRFNPNYYFHWAKADNEPVLDYKNFIKGILYIPMAHKLIGYFTVADKTDNVLKVMRSYQIYASEQIYNVVSKHDWSVVEQHGGFIWHTTGSGKTLTSFKSAFRIAETDFADKVVFLFDRVELGSQSLMEYQGFATADTSISSTENTDELVAELKSDFSKLIVTSVQKMALIDKSDKPGKKLRRTKDIEAIQQNRIVFIVDECHRSTFGDMINDIKRMFPKALFFGFTGTPIKFENSVKNCTTKDVFGDELHRYTLAHGLNDKNVLAFDTTKVLVFQDKDVRQKIALHKCNCQTVKQAMADEQAKKIYNHWMKEVPMGNDLVQGSPVFGVEHEWPDTQYNDKFKSEVVAHIIDNFDYVSNGRKFHAILATSSIPDAIRYWQLFQEADTDLKVATLYDSSDTGADGFSKEASTIEMLEYYNTTFGKSFTMSNFDLYKTDIQHRMAHKQEYSGIDGKPEQILDILIVVDQMLTGYDSKWINTLYLDKVLKYQHIIQAFSRTNRLFGPDKPFGSIFYYRYPNTMENYIKRAIEIYSGDDKFMLFVDKLADNIKGMNARYHEIEDLFVENGLYNFMTLPDDKHACQQFSRLFRELNQYLECAKVQGFYWEKLEYSILENPNAPKEKLDFDKETYLILVQRYKELSSMGGGSGNGGNVYYDIATYITEIPTDAINADYMNSKFEKFSQLEGSSANDEAKKNALEELYKTFATLSKEQQHFADMFITDFKNGKITLTPGKLIMDYIVDYQQKNFSQVVENFAEGFGLNPDDIHTILKDRITEDNINDFGRLDNLKAKIDKEKAKAYLELLEKKEIKLRQVMALADKYLRKFLIEGEV